MKKLEPYRKGDHDVWPVHVEYDELSERQVEGFIHPWGFNRHQRRAMLATARRKQRRVRDPDDLTHRRGTQAGRLLTREQRGLADETENDE